MKTMYIRGMAKAIHINRAIKYISSKSIEKFKVRMFKFWQSRVNRVHINRAKFKGKMSKKLKKVYFELLNSYV
jgi:hypothetical protein